MRIIKVVRRKKKLTLEDYQGRQEKMSAYSKEVDTESMKLTPHNIEAWSEYISDRLQPTGPEGIAIIGRTKPIPLMKKVELDQLREDDDGNDIPNYYKFKSTIKDKLGVEVLTAGKVTYTRTDAHWTEFEKAKAQRKAELDRIQDKVSKCAIIIAESISEASRALMKATDLKRYSESLAHPVDLLLFIDETHRIQNGAGVINALTNFMDCKQKDYNGDFTAFLAGISRFQRELVKKTNPSVS